VSRLSVSAYFPWSRVKVASQSVNDNPESALVRIEPDQRYRPRCHACQGSARTVHSHTRRFVRDLDFGGHEMWLQIEYRKVWCDTCGGVRVEHLEFVDVSQRLTHWDPYIKAIRRWCPRADIVFDLFHVVRAFNRIIDDIRNEEFRQADGADRQTLKGSKYLFLKNWGNLGRQQRVRLNEILAMNERLNTLYWLKDLLKHIWSYWRPGWASKAIDQWCEVARQDGHPKLVAFAGTLDRKRYGILNHCRHPIHTSRIEGVNNKIKVIKRVAYGFHDPRYFALKVKQACPGRPEDN